jgi:P4 family phage/plasmid primase-like protien
MKHDLLTLVKAKKSINKRVVLDDAGRPVKHPAGLLATAKARTVYVPDVEAMERLLRLVANDPAMVLLQGYFFDEPTDPNTFEEKCGLLVGKQFNILSQQKLADLNGEYKGGWVEVNYERAIARTKDNMLPSTWILLDRDSADGIPLHLANMTDDEWLQAIGRIIPDFARMGWVRVASTSSRVLYEGKPISDRGCHYWFQTTTDDDETLGHRMLLQAAANGLGFKKMNKAGAGTLWSIFDPTTFSHERIAFEGMPKVSGDRLMVAPPDIQAQRGPRVNSHLVSDVSPKQEKRIKSQFQIGIRRGGGIGRLEALVDCDKLTLNTVVETQKLGSITVTDYMKSGRDHLRCQATFRDSNSWNGFLKRDHEGMPRLFDNGLRMWFELDPQVKQKLRVHHLDGLIKKSDLSGLTGDQALKFLAVIRRDFPGEYLKMRNKLKAVRGISIVSLERALPAMFEAESGNSPIELAHATIRAVGTGNLIYRQGIFWYWDEQRPGCWRRMEDTSWLRKFAHEVLQDLRGQDWSSRTVDDVVKLIGPETLSTARMDPPGNGINVLNGELIETPAGLELQPHRKSTLATVCLPIRYDPEATCFRFRQFLEEIFEGQEQVRKRIKLIQQMMGYTLLRDCRYEKMIFLLGGGSNGKSVLMHVITKLLGSENVAAVQPKQYGNRFQRAHLEGKLANIVTEIGKGDLLPDDETKAMVTGEIMTVENKNQHPREIVPFATLWHATNHLPVLKDYSYAMIRRTFILQLQRNFDECPEIKDENLKTWLVENELPGILNFALNGLLSLQTDGWVEVDECRRDVEAWVKSGDTVACFLEDECDRETNSWTTTKDLYARYGRWCELHGMTKVGGKQFTTQLQTEGFTSHRTAEARGWKGISLKPMKPGAVLRDVG